MFGKALSALFMAYFFATSAFMLCIAALIRLVSQPFDPNLKLTHLFSCLWAQLYIHVNPFWKLTIKGTENMEPGKSYVLVANHQSYADIIVLYGLYRPFKWVSKESIFSVPIIGHNMKLNQYVLLKRGDMRSIKEMMGICRQWLFRGTSIMMFPEGTRSEDGQLQHFRDGAFRLAVDCKVPVVPVVIDGTHDILAKHGRSLNFVADVRVQILPPVDPSDFQVSSAKLRKHVHELMKQTLASMRSERSTDQARLSDQALRRS